MEVDIEFATFCNICFNKNNLRKIEETENLTGILMLFIENKILIKEHEIYLCLNCCEKLESYDKFKKMCLRNLIDFRIEYSELKKKLEIMNDLNLEKKLRSFIKTKVNGNNELLDFDASESTLGTEFNMTVPESENNLTEKEDETNYSIYYLNNVSYKHERVEYEDIDDYKIHIELDLEDNEIDSELPGSDKHIMESNLEEDIDKNDCSNENDLIKSATKNKSSDTTKNLTDNEQYVLVETLNKKERPNSHLECKICGKTLTKSSTLREHMRIHTDEKPYTCTVCYKSFRKVFNLKVHMLVHSGERHYSCDLCNKRFTTSNNMKRHRRTHIEKKKVDNPDEKPYACLVCGKRFRRHEHMRLHSRIHTREKPYASTNCEKTLSYENSYNNNKFIHTNERPHTCTVCKKSFKKSGHLREHEYTHNTVKPYTCEICNKGFIRLNDFKFHQNKPCARKTTQDIVIEDFEKTRFTSGS